MSARVGAKATVKTLRYRAGTMVLEPSKDGEREITIAPGTDATVIGVVCGVFRAMWDRQAMPALTGAQPVS